MRGRLPRCAMITGVILTLLFPPRPPAFASGPTGTEPSGELSFQDATSRSGIDFVHETGASGRRYMVETFGGGVIVLDYDQDGLPDLYFVNGGELPGYEGPSPENALYRNVGDGTFTDVTSIAGVEGTGYGMGGAAGDVDNDGDPDLYVTSFGRDRFYRNNGDGTFTEATAAAGLGDVRWSTSASFVDIDSDGFLDLYVCNYLDFTLSNRKRCLSPVGQVETYCHPNEYKGVEDLFYRNLGDGTFEDSSERAGVTNAREGKGLGVVAGDYDNDGDPDLYVANDSTRNFLYRNDGGVDLVDVGFESGVGFNEEGLPEAGMGTDWGDVDRDGLLDVIVTNFDLEKNTLYRSLGGGFFIDDTTRVGLADTSMTELAFGVDLADFDNDGWLDLIVTNGHILDNIALVHGNLTHAQHGQFFRNRDGRFEELSDSVGEALRRKRVGRGLATLDFDLDGDLDVVLANNGGAAELLSNEGGNHGHWVALRLMGTTSNRDALGARVEAMISGRSHLSEVKGGSSYLSQNELTMYLGLGATDVLEELTVRWPSGTVEKLPPLAAGSVYVLKEDVGMLGRFKRPRR